MAISVECSACGQSYRLKDEMAGRKIRCKGCQTPIEVPLAESEEEWGEASWPAKGSGHGGASRKTKAVQKKSGSNKSLVVVIGSVAGLVLLVALVWGLLCLPSGVLLQTIGLWRTRALPRWQAGLLAVGVLFIGFPDGAEIINLTAAVLMAAALVPYGARLVTTR